MADMIDGAVIDLAHSFDDAIDRVTDTLAEEGFGVITRIDMDKAFKEKLGLEFRRYTILGACNPKLAHTAVSAHPEIGLLLPCNVTVEETDNGSRVRLVDAQSMIGAAEPSSEILRGLADDAQERLGRVAEQLRAG